MRHSQSSPRQFTPVLALYDPFGVDVPLNLDITHSPVRPAVEMVAIASFFFRPSIRPVTRSPLEHWIKKPAMAITSQDSSLTGESNASLFGISIVELTNVGP